jgi:hypothetical protein
MQCESQWPGDAIAASFCPACDRGDVFVEGLGGSWNRVDSRADQADANMTAVVLKDRHDAVIKPAPGWSPLTPTTAACGCQQAHQPHRTR